MIRRFVVLSALGALACSAQDRTASRVSSVQSPTIAGARNTRSELAAPDTFPIDWYASVLPLFSETALRDASIPRATTVLRFVLLPAFDPGIAIRVVQQAGECTVVTTIQGQGETEWGAPDSLGLSLAVGRGTGSRIRRDSVQVPRESCMNLATMFAAAAVEGRALKRGMVMDGSEWIFETLVDGAHSVIGLDSPNPKRAPVALAAGFEALRLGRAVPQARAIR